MIDNLEEKSKTDESWIKTYWRPAMAWQYLAVCLFDFLFAPIITGWYAWFAEIPYQAWKPITLGEGGFYHMAMGAIVGVTAWARGREKVAKISANSDLSESFKDETEERIARVRRERK